MMLTDFVIMDCLNEPEHNWIFTLHFTLFVIHTIQKHVVNGFKLIFYFQFIIKEF